MYQKGYIRRQFLLVYMKLMFFYTSSLGDGQPDFLAFREHSFSVTIYTIRYGT